MFWHLILFLSVWFVIRKCPSYYSPFYNLRVCYKSFEISPGSTWNTLNKLYKIKILFSHLISYIQTISIWVLLGLYNHDNFKSPFCSKHSGILNFWHITLCGCSFTWLLLDKMIEIRNDCIPFNSSQMFPFLTFFSHMVHSHFWKVKKC